MTKFSLKAIVLSIATLGAFAQAQVALPYTDLGKTGDVEVRNGGFGSAAYKDATNPNRFYAITDRGPNADSANKGEKIFVVPTYSPTLGHFEISEDGKSIKTLKSVKLKRPDGKEITGLPNPEGYGATGEKAISPDGKELGEDEYGIDTEGLVVLEDGTFWVSDEYGPHIAHFDAEGKQIERISPLGFKNEGRKIPAVFATRRPNRGMEGLTITPDGKTLVGIMQSTMFNPSKDDLNRTVTRILAFDLETGKTKQYLYRQEQKNNSNSEIVAISNTKFLVDERDGKFVGKDDVVQKHVYLIDIEGATDVSDTDESKNGKMVNDKTLEQSSWEDLEAVGIKPVSKKLLVDLVNEINYPHDKFEGMWLKDEKTLAVINDDDFGITSDKEGKVSQKVLPSTKNIDANTVYFIPVELPKE
ncbi:esterase-like activity of phytase family protein [Taylorella equigenitalis]|uniref:Phytase-like domain-containing protein n=1 Tax=Taylorella equigenitalis (strain MCE9) TaxID=937774 RepID=A0A654KH80_TAYEM|nr:esterase-like activity of phytase family protein [Taylorella equigenitalis]ADU91745.1 hypothetical protein TEQUI_0807 [Taylorella equigenitalis MCE9]WDU56528.1 esterase-like activity of phytase family protein [Taylorella equigenitalis]